jgi:hypothetical protein
MDRAQFEKHSDIVIQFQVFAANVQAAFVVRRPNPPKPTRSCSQPSASKSNILGKAGEPFQLYPKIGNEPKNLLPSKWIPNPSSWQMFG